MSNRLKKITTTVENAVTGASSTNTIFELLLDGHDKPIDLTEQEAAELRDQFNKLCKTVVTNTSRFDWIPDNVKEFLRSGKKIDAVKALREETKMGLKEAKDAVEAWMRDEGLNGLSGYRECRPKVLRDQPIWCDDWDEYVEDGRRMGLDLDEITLRWNERQGRGKLDEQA